MATTCSYKIFLINLIVVIVTIAAEPRCPTVNTADGAIAGKYLTSRNGRQYEAYLGIRYGVVAARFEQSVVSSPWKGTLNATEFGAFCAQPNIQNGLSIGAEDCLFLNIYTPKSDNESRPVIVFVHGGAYSYGSGDLFGGKYFMDEEVVFVTFNYRLGILGFLNSRDGQVSGNMGLKDQVLALNWIRKHISNFGGDHKRVIVVGHSAGSASVTHLALSPVTSGLFHGVIAQSGTAINSWGFQEAGNLQNAVRMGNQTQCKMDTTKDLVACLKQKPLDELMGAQLKLATWYLDHMLPFVPTLEEASDTNPDPMILYTPAEILRKGYFNRIPIMLTTTKEEGALFHAAAVLRTEPLRKQLNAEWDRLAPLTFYYADNPRLSNNTGLAKELRKFYLADGEATLQNEQNLTNLYTDALFLKGVTDAALGFAKYTKTYTGVFTHRRNDFSVISLFGIMELLGVAHSDELGFLFNGAREGAPLPLVSTKDLTTKDDIEFSKRLVKMYVNFAAHGNPTGVEDEKSTKWPHVSEAEVNTKNLNWFDLGLEDRQMIDPFHERMQFWDKQYQSL